MKIVFKIIWLWVAQAALAAAPAHAEGRSNAERLAALVSYVAADYPQAVRDGKVLVAAEYDEQGGMIKEALALTPLLAPLPGHDAAKPTLVAAVQSLARLFETRADDKQLAPASRQILELLIADFGLVLTPVGAPSATRAEDVFRQTCARCHGPGGRGDGPDAAALKPPPLSFFDEERMGRVSPALAYQALTFGIAGTSMPAFDTLSSSDRWSLAFHVTSLRHDVAAAARGQAGWKAAKPDVAPTPSRLAALSDVQLRETLAPWFADAAARADAVAWLRRTATFASEPGGRFAAARRLLATVPDRHGDEARQIIVDAYLEGFEPQEAGLRARDAKLTARIEEAFGDLRHAAERHAPADELRRKVVAVGHLLDAADESSHHGASVSFFAAFAIALREGFEISLLVAALLAFVRRSGRGELARFVHYGWLAAIPAGAVTWFALGAVLGGARREVTEGILTLAAAAMLLFVSHFVLGRLEARKWLKYLERKTKAAASAEPEAGAADAGGVPWPLMSVAFVAAYREAVEIVLFFKALILDSPDGWWWVVLGAAAGVTVLMALVRVMSYLGRRLSPRPVMTASSVLLTAIAISLVGQGVRALQEAGVLHTTPIAWMPRIELAGVFPSVEGVVAQLVVLALVLLPLVKLSPRGAPAPR